MNLKRHDGAEIRQAKMLIGGHWSDAVGGGCIPVENPANRRIIGDVPEGGETDVELAVVAATEAFVSWSRVPPRERGRALMRIADAMEPRVEELARLLALETGNALRTQTRPEANGAVDVMRYFGGLASELKGETLPLSETVLSYTRREPIGVVGAIIPWNAPLMLAALKIAPALCAGNTVVLKTAEDAPLAVLLLSEICHEFLPPGVLNVLTGRGEACGEKLSRHPGVHKLTFTGSTAIGRLIMQTAGERIVPVSLELGGKSPSVVFPDGDEDWVVDGVASAMRFTRQSQSCTAGSRLFLHADIYDSFLGKLARKVEAFRLGDPLDDASDIGAIINDKQFRKVWSYIDDGLHNPDARCVVGGKPFDDGPLSEGYFVRPTVFAATSNDWRLAREEIFGPVLIAIPWTDEAEVVRMANASHYGLAAYVWTRDIGAALRCAHDIEAGWVQVNQGGGQVLGQSYGGVKQSGIGREFSLAGMIDSYTQCKSITVNLGRQA